MDDRDETLRTARLSLRRPDPTDIAAIRTVHSDPRTCVHNPSDALASFAEADSLFQRWDEHWRQYGFGYWVVRRHDSDERLGFCGLKVMEFRNQRILNLFYRFAPGSWGKGFASEAATATVQWASARQPHLAVIARVRPENFASQRVAARAGLVRAEHLDGPGFDGFDWIFTTADFAQA